MTCAMLPLVMCEGISNKQLKGNFVIGIAKVHQTLSYLLKKKNLIASLSQS